MQVIKEERLPCLSPDKRMSLTSHFARQNFSFLIEKAFVIDNQNFKTSKPLNPYAFCQINLTVQASRFKTTNTEQRTKKQYSII